MPEATGSNPLVALRAETTVTLVAMRKAAQTYPAHHCYLLSLVMICSDRMLLPERQAVFLRSVIVYYPVQDWKPAWTRHRSVLYLFASPLVWFASPHQNLICRQLRSLFLISFSLRDYF